MLINSYLLSYSVTPMKLKMLAKLKRSVEKKKGNTRKALLHKQCFKSLKKYNDWEKQEKLRKAKAHCEEVIKLAKMKLEEEAKKNELPVNSHSTENMDNETNKRIKIVDDMLPSMSC